MRKLWLLGLFVVVIIGGIILGYQLGHKATTVLPSPSPTPAPSASPTASALPARCIAAELRLNLAAASAGAGHMYENLEFINTGTRTCELHGFPGVSLVDTYGKQLGQPATEAAGSTITTVSLAPGQSAFAALDFPQPGNFQAGQCSAAAVNLKVFAPGETTPLLVPSTHQSCPGWQVQPVKSTPLS